MPLLADKEVPTDEDWEEAKASMLRAVNDAKFYCSEYSSKEQPHINGYIYILYYIYSWGNRIYIGGMTSVRSSVPYDVTNGEAIIGRGATSAHVYKHRSCLCFSSQSRFVSASSLRMNDYRDYCSFFSFISRCIVH